MVATQNHANSNLPLRIAIIGAGSAGLVLAKTLLHLNQQSSRPITVQVFEKWSALKTRGGSLQLQQGVEILRRLGLEEEIHAISNAQKSMTVSTGTKALKTVDVSSVGEKAMRSVMRSDLQKLLFNSLPEGVVELGRTVVDVREEPSSATVEFDDGSTVVCDLVVGCDGMHSKVAKCMFSDYEPEYVGHRICYAISKTPVRVNSQAVKYNWYRGEDGRGMATMSLTSGIGELRHDIFVMIDHCDEPVSAAWDATALKDTMRSLATTVETENGLLLEKNKNQADPEMRNVIEAANNIFQWGVYRTPSRETWTSPCKHVVILGDAAHATAPYLGQGANMAMQDAFCLGKLLIEATVTADMSTAKDKAPTKRAGGVDLSVVEALADFERIRRKEVEKVVDKASTIGKAHTASGWQGWLRDMILPMIPDSMLLSTMVRDPVV